MSVLTVVGDAVSALYPCAVKGCDATQVVVEQDDQWTVVECAGHECRTRHETTAREEREQKVMRPGWAQYAVRPFKR